MCIEAVKAYSPESERAAGKLGIRLSGDADYVLVYGTDREILEALRSRDEVVVGISPRGIDAELAFASEDLYPLVASRAECTVVKIPRLHAESGGSVVRAVNEVAIFPRRSAALTSYKVRVDGLVVFSDVADGVLVSTPLGSSAYARSAGGPVIDLEAEVLEIVPVNSTSRRPPYVAPLGKRIEISDVRSRFLPELIADGRTRIPLADGRAAVWAGSAARLLRPVAARREAEPAGRLSPSMRYVLKTLEERGPLTSRSIAEFTGLPLRTVEYALSALRRAGLVEAKMFGGLRVYSIKP
ncbi:MAG: NAD(+)/NADH kinase [Thermoproteus sp.]|nr:NAD(+)/NADH kinase [Thermoproteus sp.]